MIEQFNNLFSRRYHCKIAQPYELQPNKTYLFAFDEELWDAQDIFQWFNKLKEILPEEINIGLIPKSTIIKEEK